MLADLRSHRIDDLLIWTDGESPGDGTSARELRRRFPDTTGGRIDELTILDLTHDRQ